MCASARRPAVGSEEDETRCRCDEGEPCKCHTKRKSSRKSKGGSCHRRANDEAAHVNGLGIADLDVLLGLNGRSSDVDMTTTLPSLKPPLQNGEIKADSIDNLDLASSIRLSKALVYLWNLLVSMKQEAHIQLRTQH